MVKNCQKMHYAEEKLGLVLINDNVSRVSLFNYKTDKMIFQDQDFHLLLMWYATLLFLLDIWPAPSIITGKYTEVKHVEILAKIR